MFLGFHAEAEGSQKLDAAAEVSRRIVALMGHMTLEPWLHRTDKVGRPFGHHNMISDNQKASSIRCSINTRGWFLDPRPCDQFWCGVLGLPFPPGLKPQEPECTRKM